MIERRASLRHQFKHAEGLELGCSGCWYFGRSRSGDRLCNRTGEMLPYYKYKKGCDVRTEAPPDSSDQSDPLQPLADRLGVTVEELRRYMNNEKSQKQPAEKP